MKKIAVLGFTPREEVIVSKLKEQNPEIKISLFTDSLNLPLQKRVDEIHPLNEESLKVISESNFDFVFLGPEKYSTKGFQEKLANQGVRVIGCDQEQILIETDKSLLKEKFPILNDFFAPYKIIYTFNKKNILNIFKEFKKYVIKYPGIYKIVGGGTKIFPEHLKDENEALEYIRVCIKECGKAIIEKYIEGIDFSVNAISGADGSVFFFPENYCYKTRNNGNTGPNTSGTGSFAFSDGLPFLTEGQTQKSHAITIEVVKQTNAFFQKTLISGLNLDFRKGLDDKVYLLEVNARFAGAGTLSTVIDICDNNLYELFESSLSKSFSNLKFKQNANCSLGVFVFPPFFPDQEKSEILLNIPNFLSVPTNINLYTGWVNIIEEKPDGYFVELMNSTALLFQNKGDSIETCQEAIYKLLKNLPPDLIYRDDIGNI